MSSSHRTNNSYEQPVACPETATINKNNKQNDKSSHIHNVQFIIYITKTSLKNNGKAISESTH